MAPILNLVSASGRTLLPAPGRTVQCHHRRLAVVGCRLEHHRMAMPRNRSPSKQRGVELAALRDSEQETLPLVQRGEETRPPHDDDLVDWGATGLCFAFPAVGGALFGFDIGATSGVLVSLTSQSMSGTDWYALSSFQSGLVVSMSLLGALLGSLGALAAGNRVGRRTELLLASLLYGLSAAGMGTAGSLNALLVGRLVYGVGMGVAMHAAPAYIAETSPPNVRGLLISLKEAAIVLGILGGYLAGSVFIGEVGGWRSMYGVAAPLAAILGIGMATLPESPRWLLLSGASKEEATRALVRAEGKRASDPARVRAEVQEIAAGIADAQAGSSGGGGGVVASLASLVSEQRYSRPLLVGMSLMLLQQITGQPSVLYYASRIFEQAGFSSSSATEVSVILGAFKLVMTLVAVLTVDRLGRRPLLLTGISGMTLALLALAAAQGNGPVSTATAAAAAAGAGGPAAGAVASVIALLLYVGCYQVSFGPISWLIVGEVFPLAVRAQAIALATFVNFGSNFLVSLALPSVQETFGMRSTYLSFAAISALAVANVWFNVPETKGKTLEQIEALWGTPNNGGASNGSGRPGGSED